MLSCWCVCAGTVKAAAVLAAAVHSAAALLHVSHVQHTRSHVCAGASETAAADMPRQVIQQQPLCMPSMCNSQIEMYVQERLRQQQYLRQQFIQQQQQERQQAAQAQLASQAQADMQDSWGRPEQKSFDVGNMRHDGSITSTPDKSHQLHSAPTRCTAPFVCRVFGPTHHLMRCSEQQFCTTNVILRQQVSHWVLDPALVLLRWCAELVVLQCQCIQVS